MRDHNRYLEFEEICEEFKHMCPWAKDNVISANDLNTGEVMFELKDGSFMSYDSITKSFDFYKNRADTINKRFPKDEHKWHQQFIYRLYREFIIKGYSQKDVSDLTGISQGAISKYINGDSVPTIINLIRIARALNLTDKELLRILCYK